jgi:hypothetical protein
MTIDSNGTISVRELRGGTSTNLNVGFCVGEWANITIRFHHDTQSYEFIVNGSVLYAAPSDATNTKLPLEELATVRLSFDSMLKGTILIDNVEFRDVNLVS